MPSYASLLRAVNLGTQPRVPNLALVELAGSLGWTDLRAHLGSGNLTFRTRATPTPRLERALEGRLEGRFGRRVDVLTRSRRTWERVVRSNPLPKAAQDDPGHLVVVFLKGAPNPGGLASLRALARPGEEIRPVGTELYVYYGSGIGASRVTGDALHRALGVIGTGRNWNTVLKLAAAMR